MFPDWGAHWRTRGRDLVKKPQGSADSALSTTENGVTTSWVYRETCDVLLPLPG
jgi:hypothetical protein